MGWEKVNISDIDRLLQCQLNNEVSTPQSTANKEKIEMVLTTAMKQRNISPEDEKKFYSNIKDRISKIGGETITFQKFKDIVKQTADDAKLPVQGDRANQRELVALEQQMRQEFRVTKREAQDVKELCEKLENTLKKLTPSQVGALAKTETFKILMGDLYYGPVFTQTLSVASLAKLAENAPPELAPALNQFIDRLDPEDPKLEEKLRAIASSGFVGVKEQFITAKAKNLEKGNEIVQLWTEAKEKRYSGGDLVSKLKSGAENLNIQELKKYDIIKLGISKEFWNLISTNGPMRKMFVETLSPEQIATLAESTHSKGLNSLLTALKKEDPSFQAKVQAFAKSGSLGLQAEAFPKEMAEIWETAKKQHLTPKTPLKAEPKTQPTPETVAPPPPSVARSNKKSLSDEQIDDFIKKMRGAPDELKSLGELDDESLKRMSQRLEASSLEKLWRIEAQVVTALSEKDARNQRLATIFSNLNLSQLESSCESTKFFDIICDREYAQTAATYLPAEICGTLVRKITQRYIGGLEQFINKIPLTPQEQANAKLSEMERALAERKPIDFPVKKSLEAAIAKRKHQVRLAK